MNPRQSIRAVFAKQTRKQISTNKFV